MWILSILLGLSLSNMLMANFNEDLEQCMISSNLTSIDLENIPSINLHRACPRLIQFLDCVEDIVKDHTGLNLVELASLLPANTGQSALVLLNIRSLLDDLCTKGSELNTMYKKTKACFKVISPQNKLCTENALRAYEVYSELEKQRGNSEENNKQCMMEAYKSACIGAKIHKTCGQSAFDLYQTVINRIGLFRVLLCSPEELIELKTKFLRTLDLTERERNIYRAGFEFRKRKK